MLTSATRALVAACFVFGSSVGLVPVAAAQSAPPARQAPSTDPQPGDLSCGTDIGCFSGQAATCTASTVTYTVSVDLAPLAGLTSGLQSNTTDTMRLSPDASDAATCRLALVVQHVDTQLLPDATKELGAAGLDQAAIDALQAGLAETNRTLEGRWANCAFAPRDLASMLGSWAIGSFSTDDFSLGTCSGTYFGQ